MSWRFERVAGPFERARGPVWDGSGVLFADAPSGQVRRYDLAADVCATVRSGADGVTDLAFGPDGRLYGCESGAGRVVRYREDGEAEPLADEYEGRALNGPADLSFDGGGRLWFGDPATPERQGGETGHASVYRLDPARDPRQVSEAGQEWDVTRVTYDTTDPTGVLVADDRSTLFVAQSEAGVGNRRELRAYPIREDGSAGDYEVVHNFYPHRGIDGMCLDREGNVVAAAGCDRSGPGSMLYVFTPTGRVLRTHPFPGGRPTDCAFGGDDLGTLFVTSADGCLYRAETDRTGRLDAPDRPRI